MSRRFFHLVREGRKLTVVAGHDRPLSTLFLQLLQDSAATDNEDVLLYSSLSEPKLDWTDINTVADKLAALGIEPPDSLIEGVFLDQCLDIGNLMVEHHFDRAPTVLYAG